MLYLCIYLSGRNLRYVDKRQPGGKTHYPLGGYPPDIRRILKYLRQIARETSSTRRAAGYTLDIRIYIYIRILGFAPRSANQATVTHHLKSGGGGGDRVLLSLRRLHV